MAVPRGALVLSAALTLALAVTMLVVDGGVRRDNVLEMREELALKPLTYGGTEGKSTADPWSRRCATGAPRSYVTKRPPPKAPSSETRALKVSTESLSRWLGRKSPPPAW